MINVLIQALTLISGLLVNFFVPALYGLDAYGEFIKANILVFIFQRLLDLTNEQLIAGVESRYLLVTSGFLAGMLYLIFCLVNAVEHIGEPLLLGAMLLSSVCLLSLFALRLHAWILTYMVLFFGVFFGVISTNYFWGVQIDITGVLIATNLIPAIFAVVVILWNGAKFPPAAELSSTLLRSLVLLPRMIATALVFNLLTNILPFVLSKTLPARDLGLFRVVVSIIQSATSLFPVNVKAIFVSLVSAGNGRDRVFRTILSASLFYFALIGLFGYAVEGLFPRVGPYLVMLPCLPALFWAVVTERYLVASGHHRHVVRANLFVASVGCLALLFVEELKQAELYYSVGFSCYLLTLSLGSTKDKAVRAALWAVAVGPAAIWLGKISVVWAAFYLLLLLMIAGLVLKIRLSDIRNLGFK